MTQYRNIFYYLLITLLLTACATKPPEVDKPPDGLIIDDGPIVPKTPGILRLNTDMHTAAIKRIAIDAKGQYLVTGSDDKTARVWSFFSFPRSAWECWFGTLGVPCHHSTRSVQAAFPRGAWERENIFITYRKRT